MVKKFFKYIKSIVVDKKSEITLFINSAAIMMVELLASRILAPYIGTSYIVWVSIIGIVMVSLSAGYIIGGKLADKSNNKNKSNNNNIAIIYTMLSAYICFIIMSGNNIVGQIVSLKMPFTLTVIIVNIVLFLVPNILFGMVSPIIYKGKLKDQENTGQKVGTLNAVSTIGSIVGTFLVGFVLLPLMGTKNVLLVIGILLVIVAIYNSNDFKNKLVMLNLLMLIILIITGAINNIHKETALVNIDIDSKYSRIMIKDYEVESKIYRDVRVDEFGTQSIMEVSEPNKLIAEYTKYYDLFEQYNPETKKVLFLGGGAYSYPKHYISTKQNDSTIDVVEIDEKFTEVAKEYFELKENDRLKIYHEDARMYIEKNSKKYDAIFNDCFNSLTVPPQVLTVEFMKKIKISLNKNGVYIMNVIAPIEGNTRILDTLINTIEKHFKRVDIYKVNKDVNPKHYQNIILVGTDNKEIEVNKNSEYNRINYIKKNSKRIYTDDNCPIDIWILKDNNLLKRR